MPHTEFKWDDVRYLLACWRAGNLAAAGRMLGVDQTTAGRRLAALERDLGARLFDRTSGGFSLTSTGEHIIDIALSIEQGTIDLQRVANGRDARLEGVVRLATTETLAATFVMRALAALHEAHPGIEIEVISGLPLVNLLKREADLALRVGRPHQQTLVVRKVGEVRIHFYASPAWLARCGGTVRSVGDHDLIGYCDELRHTSVARWIEEQAAKGRIALRTNSFLAAADAARRGWGIACLPAFIVGDDPALRRLEAPGPEPTDLWLAVHRDLQRTPRVRAVMQHLIAALADAADLAAPARSTASASTPAPRRRRRKQRR